MICHDLKCIFVHIPKTAGQSIEQYFLDHLGLAHHERQQLLLGKNTNPEAGPPQLSHLTARQYTAGGHIRTVEFDAYFKFGFVRNPWDRLVSFYKYRGHAHRYDFKTFVFKHMPRPGWSNDYCHVMSQYEYLYADGRRLVDFVGRFERLQPDFDTVCTQLGLPILPLPHLNRGLRQYSLQAVLTSKPRKILRNFKRLLRQGRLQQHTFSHYSGYYDAETRAYVAERYRQDIEAFGYTFESPAPTGANERASAPNPLRPHP